MPFNPNLPYSQVHGASGPAVFEQGGVFYERDGTQVPAPTDESVFPVMGKTNPLTGGSRLLVGGENAISAMGVNFERRISPALPMHFLGNQIGSQSNSANTWCHKVSVPDDFDAVKLVLYHNVATAPTVKAIIAATDTAAQDTAQKMFEPMVAGAAYNSIDSAESYGWKTVTWSGASTKAFAGTGSQFQPETIISDLIPLSSVPRSDGGSNPLIMFRVYVDGAAATLLFTPCAASLRTEGGANGKQIIQVSTRNNDGIASPAAYPAALATSSLSFGLVLYSRSRGISVMTIGDSITQNDGIVTDKVSSWGARGVDSASSQSAPMAYINAGCSGQTSLTYTAAGLAQLAKWNPNVAHFSAYSPNDYSTPSAAALRLAIQKMAGRLQQFLEYCYSNRIIPIVSTGIPHSAATGLNTAPLDQQRKDYNARLRAMAADGFFHLLDFDKLLSDGGSPAAIQAAYSAGDGVHPNEAGIALMGTAFASVLATLPR